ncbi:MAG: hypothetical protein GX800_07045, partial [Clostridiaceae bacterium]|nr:hypothetical protein [Clostridiaceae bacterium]
MTDNKAEQQMKMFKKEIPQMPEGYYSPGPNPNLEKFIMEHSTPYDPATDDYDVPPFDKPIKTSKRTAIYNMHSYPSKKPHDAIQQYIRHYTKPGDLVLDTFCGSGGTALAALMEGRKAIAIDLSPAATFITKTYCTPIDINYLQRAFNELKKTIKPEIDWLYETRCDRCNGRAMTNYVVWSYVFECPRCLKKVPIYDCPEVDVPNKKGDGTKKVKVCPYCKKLGNLEQISSRTAKRFDPVPVLVNYKCLDGCEPSNIERKHNDKDPKKLNFFEIYDIEKISEIENKTIPYWYPTTKFPVNFSKWKTDLKSLGINSIDQMYSKRNLWAISLIRNYALRNIKYKDWLLFTLTGTLLALSRMQRYSPNSTFPNMLLPNTLYIAPLHKEYNALDWFYGKKRGVINGAEELQVINEILLISTDTATNLQIKNDSVDYIFTDPPYSDKVQYGELNFVLEAWLDLKLNWHDQEIIVNENRGLTEEYWAEMIKNSMAECYRVLKPGRCISLCYHDTSEGTWQLVQDIMAEVGFIVEKGNKTLYIDAKEKSFNQIKAQKVTKRDLVINFRKPRPGEIHAAIAITGDEDERTFSQKARAILTEALERTPGSTADRLYDELVSRMVRKGEFERHNFDKLLRNVAEEVRTPDASGNAISRWYLLETAGEVDAAESQKESAAAERLEAFMATYLKDHPEFDGVHYSDLFEQYLPLRDKPRRLLADWLPEFFYRTPEGTWRPPKEDEERQQKADLRTNGTLRRARRF